MNTNRLSYAVLATLLSAAAFTASAATTVSMCKLDGGKIQVNDLNAFSDVDAYTGQSKLLPAPAYLIKHNGHYMLWDAGLPLSFLGAKINSADVMSGTVDSSLRDQLSKIGIDPGSVEIVGLSHTHFDHTGQAGEFPQATLMLGQQDYDDLSSKSPQVNVDATTLSHWVSSGGSVRAVSGDTDVYGDGSVRMLSTPGHTSGHHSLLVQLKSGPVLLTGDVWNFQAQVAINGVPPFATNRADVLASETRLTGLAKNRKALVVIQHEPADADKIPNCTH
ncbi:N-acyl homoserine lactonase family protein [Xanthomonas euvesicatoria]|uniref:N-acyl homoserine lactonase family protein n=1 Tax=Xanthomonas euvesicatoria TaxID=456327 RepID=UPI0030C85C72